MSKHISPPRYRKIQCNLWRDEAFLALSALPPSGQSLYLYLLTGPDSTDIPGIYLSGKAALAEQLGWDDKGFGEAFQQVFGKGLGEGFPKGFPKGFWEGRLIYLPEAIKTNKPGNTNVIKGWSKTWDMVPNCALKLEAYKGLKSAMQDCGELYFKAFLKACKEQVLEEHKDLPEALPKGLGEGFPKGFPKAQDLEQNLDDSEGNLGGENGCSDPICKKRRSDKRIYSCQTGIFDHRCEQGILICLKDLNSKHKTLKHKRLKPLSNYNQFDVESQNLKPKVKTSVSQARRRGDTHPDVLDVFEHWKNVMDHPKARLESYFAKNSRNKLISDWLVSYDSAALKKAITGLSLWPHFMGSNKSNTRYDGLEHVLKNASRIDTLIRLVDNQPNAAKEKIKREQPGIVDWLIQSAQNEQPNDNDEPDSTKILESGITINHPEEN